MLRAMYRIVILFISIAWAALLLLSWSGPVDSAPQPAPLIDNAS